MTGPWRRPADGDLLDIEQSVDAALIAVVISVLGAWVALIIAEQTIYLKRQGSRYWPLWLLLVAVALGGVAVWCTQVLLSTALQTSLPSSDHALPMSYSFDVAMLSLVPSLLLTYVGLLLLMGDVGYRSNYSGEGSSTQLSTSETRTARSAEWDLIVRKREEKRAASLSTPLHLQHLRRSMTWRVIVGGTIVALAMYSTRFTLFHIWLQPASWSLSVYASVFTWPFDCVLMVLSCLWFFHALRARYVGAFLFAACVVGDWFMMVQSLTFRYETSGKSVAKALVTADVSYTTISLVSGIIAAFICFVFIGLQFSRMQLSRNGLSVLAASMQASIARLQDKLTARDDTIAQLKHQLSQVCRLTAFTAINTPIHTHYAYCMAQATTVEVYHSLWKNNVSSAASSTASSSLLARGRSYLTVAQKLTPSLSFESSPALQPRMLPTDATETSSSGKLPLRLPFLGATPGKLASIVPLPALSLFGARNSSTASHSNDEIERSSDAQTVAEPSQTAAATEQSRLSTAAPTERRQASGSIGDARGAAADIATARRQQLSSTSLQRTQRFSSNSNRNYEEQLAALLDQSEILDSSSTPPAILSPKGGQSNKASLSIPAVASSAATFNGSLADLLVHPACVAVIKGELQAIHSVENLIFYLHAQRYRQLQSAKLRKTVATAMFDTFVREGADQEININATQRDSIAMYVTKRGDDSCGSGLFDEAQREVLRLMETNLLGSKAERQCAWLMVNMPLEALVGVASSNDENGDSVSETAS